MIALTALALIIAVSLLCRSIMAAERETISLLHIMGAEDNDIARHFAYHAGRLSFPASLMGFVLAVASAGGMLFFLRNFVDPGAISPYYWTGLGVAMTAVPLAAILIAALSARLSTLNDLAEMP